MVVNINQSRGGVKTRESEVPKTRRPTRRMPAWRAETLTLMDRLSMAPTPGTRLLENPTANQAPPVGHFAPASLALLWNVKAEAMLLENTYF
jgi:hypothetical protein